MDEKIDLEKIEKKGNVFKKWLKLRHPFVYLLLVLLVLYIFTFGGAFLHDSTIIQKYNIFPEWFGQKEVEIDFKPSPNVYSDSTLIPFYVRNIGDKDINEINIFYTFCGLEESKAILNKNKLYKDEQISFVIETLLILNTSCQAYTNKIWADVYEDSERNCYIDVPDDITENYCSFCKVRFSIFLDEEKQEGELWYPYLGDDINAGEFMRNLLVYYPVNITWVQNYSSQCKVLAPNSPKTGLSTKEKLGLGFFDTYVMCERGDDIEWCKENYYGKQ